MKYLKLFFYSSMNHETSFHCDNICYFLCIRVCINRIIIFAVKPHHKACTLLCTMAKDGHTQISDRTDDNYYETDIDEDYYTETGNERNPDQSASVGLKRARAKSPTNASVERGRSSR